MRRRTFLGLSVVAAAAGAFTFLRDNGAELTEADEELLDKFSRNYRENPENLELADALRLFWLQEYSLTTGDAIKWEALEEDTKAFVERWEQALPEKILTEDATVNDELVALIVQYRDGLHAIMADPEKPYNEDYASIADPMLNGRLQCRSGTKILTWLLLSSEDLMVQLDKLGIMLVEIHTNGHTLPGFVTSEGKLIGIDSVVGGKGIAEFGTLDELKENGFPVNVVDARHAFANEAIGGEVIHPNAYYVLRNVHLEIATGFDVGGTINRVIKSITGTGILPSPASFGVADVPEGDQTLSEQNRINPSQYLNPGGPSEAFYGRGESLVVDLNSLNLNATDRKVVQDYLVQSAPLTEYWNQHTPWVNGEVDFTRHQAQAFIDGLGRFVVDNQLQDKYKAAVRILEPKGVVFTNKSPLGILRAITNNLNIRLRERG